MKKSWRNVIHSVILISGIFAVTISCNEDEGNGLSPEKLQAISKTAAENNHLVIVATQEVLDIASSVLSEEGISIQESNARPENCAPALLREYVMDRTHRDTIIYAGTITMDYGNGSTCQAEGPVRAGKIKNTFTYIISMLNNGTFKVYQTIDFEDYKRDTLTLTGKFRTDAQTGEGDSLETFGARVNFKSGASIHWNGTLVNTRINSGSLADDLKTITGKINGITSEGYPFAANITKGITYSYDCSGNGSLIPVEGVLTMTVRQNNVRIDYGNGECNREYAVTVNGITNIYSF